MRLTSRTVHHFVRGMIFIGFAVYIFYLVRTGYMTYYIAPRMEPYVKASGLLFYVLSVQQFYAGIVGVWRHRRSDCGCDHIPGGFPLKSVMMYALFVLPLAMGILLPDTVLASAMADQKGMRLSALGPDTVKSVGASAPAAKNVTRPGNSEEGDEAPPAAENPDTAETEPADLNGNRAESAAETSSAPSQETSPEPSQETSSEPARETEPVQESSSDSLDALFPSDPFTKIYTNYAKTIYDDERIVVDEKSYIEILTTLDLYLDAFEGKEIELTGFVYRTDALEDNQFVVGRFAMSCCSADALPYGVLSEFANAPTLLNDEWVTVRGKLGKTWFNEMEIMKIDVTTVTRTQAPSEPYVYPNFDFGLDL